MRNLHNIILCRLQYATQLTYTKILVVVGCVVLILRSDLSI